MGVKEQYRDYVMTGFVKRVEPVVADHGDGALLYDADGTEYIDCLPWPRPRSSCTPAPTSTTSSP
jgi:4-aminobutyrate aminotransferase-like enzyme